MHVDWETLKEMLASPEYETLEIHGIEDSGEDRYLGRIGIHRERPAFRYGYRFDFAAGSAFRKRRFEFDDLGRRGWAVLFLRRFVHRARDPAEEEYLAGWTLDGHDAGLDGWIETMNEHIAAVLGNRGKA